MRAMRRTTTPAAMIGIAFRRLRRGAGSGTVSGSASASASASAPGIGELRVSAMERLRPGGEGDNDQVGTGPVEGALPDGALARNPCRTP